MTYGNAPSRSRTYNLNAQGYNARVPIRCTTERNPRLFVVRGGRNTPPKRLECATNVQRTVFGRTSPGPRPVGGAA